MTGHLGTDNNCRSRVRTSETWEWAKVNINEGGDQPDCFSDYKDGARELPSLSWLHLAHGVWQARRGKAFNQEMETKSTLDTSEMCWRGLSVEFLQDPNSTQVTLAYPTLSHGSLSQSARMSSTPFFLLLCLLSSLHSLNPHPRPVPFLWEDCNSFLTDLLAPDSSS